MKPQTKSSASSQSSCCKAQTCTNAKCTAEQIRARAYQIYQKRNGNGVSGDQLTDWLQAEHELTDAARGEILMKGDQE
jgi:hypothetical protein